MITRLSAQALMAVGNIDADTAERITGMVQALEEMGIPLLDGLSGLELIDADDRLEQAKKVISGLKPGLTHFIIHPAKDTHELRQITASWDCRVADYETFTSDAMRDFIKNEGIQVIGYRELQVLMPISRPANTTETARGSLSKDAKTPRSISWRGRSGCCGFGCCAWLNSTAVHLD